MSTYLSFHHSSSNHHVLVIRPDWSNIHLERPLQVPQASFKLLLRCFWSFYGSSEGYKLLRDYQIARGFDPTTTDFARHCGYLNPLYRPAKMEVSRFKDISEPEGKFVPWSSLRTFSADFDLGLAELTVGGPHDPRCTFAQPEQGLAEMSFAVLSGDEPPQRKLDETQASPFHTHIDLLVLSDHDATVRLGIKYDACQGKYHILAFILCLIINV
ncbi:hypothetical protein PQX77_013466 [Marasmius sp. AFHP31]|nr:hypothetical protein PQX77_013466 [Marasmius sp. AFHP31]